MKAKILRSSASDSLPSFDEPVESGEGLGMGLFVRQGMPCLYP